MDQMDFDHIFGDDDRTVALKDWIIWKLATGQSP